MFNIDVEKTSDVAIVRCMGRLVRGAAVSTLKSVVVSEKSTRMILLDLSEIEALDAGGVNALVGLHHWALTRGIKVKIVDPSRFVLEIMSSFHLDRVFDISSLRDALLVLSGRTCAEIAAARLLHADSPIMAGIF